jgi:hypothetical protein
MAPEDISAKICSSINLFSLSATVGIFDYMSGAFGISNWRSEKVLVMSVPPVEFGLNYHVCFTINTFGLVTKSTRQSPLITRSLITNQHLSSLKNSYPVGD